MISAATLRGQRRVAQRQPARSSDSNFFDSTISLLGRDVTTKDPNYDNNLGFDADVIDGNGKIANSATSASIKLTTSSDTYLPSVAWTAIDLYSPNLQSTKSASDLNGGKIEHGDEIEYTIKGTNIGDDIAQNVVVSDLVPANTVYVPGSLRITAGAGTGTYTDAVGDDRAEFQAGPGQVVFRVGTDATAIAGGTIAPQASYEVRFRVRIADSGPAARRSRTRRA